MAHRSKYSRGVFDILPTKDGYVNIVFKKSHYGGETQFNGFGLTISKNYAGDYRDASSYYVLASKDKN